MKQIFINRRNFFFLLSAISCTFFIPKTKKYQYCKKGKNKKSITFYNENKLQYPNTKTLNIITYI